MDPQQFSVKLVFFFNSSLPLQNSPAFVKDNECILANSAGNMATLNIEAGVMNKS